ncbi:hypothetical protein Gpo141_00001909 [Globisporangium polare]
MAAVIESKEMQLGACYGRYKGWKGVGAVAAAEPEAPAAADSEELPEPASSSAEELSADANAGATAATTPAVAVAPTPAPPGAIVVQFEAMAREDFRVGFAPPRVGKEPSQWAYEVAVGFSGNTEVIWRKNVSSKSGNSNTGVKEVDLVKVFAGRTCSLQDFVSYWIVVQQGVLVFGLGAQVGVDTIAKYVDDESVAAVQQVALTTWDTPATFRNVVYTPVYDAPLDVASMLPGTIVRADPSGNVDLVTTPEREEYEKAFEAAKRRAERFGGEFVAPAIKTFIDPKTIRKLQRTGAVEPGFATGFDLTSQDEISKREQRMKRFNTPEFALEYSTETVRALSEGLTQEQWAEKQKDKEKLRERALKFGLSVDQQGAKEIELTPANGKVLKERCDVRGDTMVEFREDAIHIYSLDDRFQQVRTSDVLAYFVGYGPSYVEWINDSSCTVVFEDPFTAGRALVSLSQEIPPQSKKTKSEAESATAEDVEMDGEASASGEPAAVKEEDGEVPDEDFNRSAWRFGLPIGSSSQPSHKKWRLLLRKATEDDFPAEKTEKKYHERGSNGRHLQQRGRGHRQERGQERSGGGAMPSRYNSSSRSSGGGRARAHPYSNNERSGGGRRRGDRREPRDFDDDRDDDRRDTGKPSDRIRVNDDGSINFVRSGDSTAKSESGPVASAPSEAAN